MAKKVLVNCIERATGVKYQAQEIEGGYQVFTEDGVPYKRIKLSTYLKNFKVCKEQPEEEKAEEKAEEKKPEPKKEKAEPISDEKREKMINKIKKMMALAENNPSEEEALAAALQAHKLMIKYNIHEDDVALEEIKDDIISVFSQQKHNSGLHKWREQLAVSIAQAFRCKCYLSGKDVVFRGYREDATIALEVYLMLYSVGDKLGSKAYKKQMEETGSGKGAYNSVTIGFLHGVKDALNEQCTALMVVTPKEVEEEYVEFSKNFKQGRAAHFGSINTELYKEGYEEGKKSVKSRALENKKGGKH